MPTQRIAVRIPRNQTDPDAQAFITAAGITDTTQKTAINTLVVNLKAYGIWTKMKALYPMVGGTAASHKFNLKDPRDLAAAYRLTFNGGWTHSANGALPNGTNAFADTKFNLNTNTTLSSISMAYYSRTARPNTDSSVEIGAYEGAPILNGAYLIYNSFNSVQYRAFNSLESSGGSVSNPTTGLLLGTRINLTTEKYFQSGSLLQTRTASATTTTSPINRNVYIGAYNQSGTTALYTYKQCAFASIGDGLTDTEAANLYTAVQAFQTTLGRQV